MATAKELPRQIAVQLPPQYVLWLKQFVIDTINEIDGDVTTLEGDITTLENDKANRGTGNTGNILLLSVGGDYEDSGYTADDFRSALDSQFGDDTNYSEFEEDGTLKFYGDATVYKNEPNELIGKRLESPGSNITYDNSDGSVVFADTCTLVDYIICNVQINHDWMLGTDIYPILYWWQTSSNLPNWLIQYRWQISDDAKTTSWTSVARVSEKFTYSSGTLNQITSFGSITPPIGYDISDIIQFRILRDTNNDSTLFSGADPLTGDVDGLSFGIHKQIDSIGSRQEYVK